jgi:hypothetical protein
MTKEDAEALLADFSARDDDSEVEVESRAPSRPRPYLLWISIFLALFFCIISIILTFQITYWGWDENSRKEPTEKKTIPGPAFHTLDMEQRLGEKPVTPGAEVISISYGPYTMKPRSMRPQEVYVNVEKPCTDCYIVAMHAFTRDMNGTEISTSSGVWMHHMILFNQGRPDPVCPNMAGERFFGSGNDRWTRRWNTIGHWGYKIDPDDQWVLVVELMNESDMEQDVNIVVRYEVISASSPEGKDYNGIASVWLDLTDCGDAEVEVKSVTEPFEYRTTNWTSPIKGILIDMGCHMHDGGVNMTAYRNDEPVCTSSVLYDNQVQAEKKHIVATGRCKGAGTVDVGDVMWADAHYDPTLYHMAFHDGKPDTVMGTMGAYIGLTE